MKQHTIIKTITLSIAFLLAFTSCSEEFIEVSHPSELALSSFYKTPQDAQFAVNICYTPQMHQGLFGRNWFQLFSTFEDRVLYETTGLDNINISSNNGFSQQLFRDCYRMLWRSSHVIHNMEESQDVMGLDDQELALLKGQCKAIQGMSYFFLVTIYNKPHFYDENSLPDDPETLFANSEPIEFWEGLQSSLEYAIDNLPETWEGPDLGRITSGGAKALLGKALLWKYYHYYMRFGITEGRDADLEYAKQLLREVIYEGPYELIQPKDPNNAMDVINAYQCNFSYVDLPSSQGEEVYPGENNRESVWEIQFSDERNSNPYLPGWLATGNLLTQYYSPHENSFKNHEVHPDLYYKFEDAAGDAAGLGLVKDPRTYGTLYMDGDKMDFRDTEYNTSYLTGTHNKRIAQNRGLNYATQPSGSFGIKKYHYPVYSEKEAPLNSPVNVRYIRLSDVMLLYAEACMLTDDHAPGIVELNKVRTRVGMPPKSAPITPQMIMDEREYELSLEGHRYLDLIRWSFDPQFNIDWNEIYDGNPIFTEGKNEYMPIPLSEIDVNNGALEQNPGW